ncbi:MAG TPA: ferritin-like domain-containing protein [Prosthecobacter sp.]|nr:ferritin-like domain-containing protein [Prosthecobacter sp.]
MDTREELMDWLRDAYAMERGQELMLKKQAENEELEPTLRQQMAMHLAETRAHAAALEGCLRLMGSDTSVLKTVMSSGAALAQGLATAFASDERVKDLLTAYASEHFEIACYQALRTAAEMLGENDVVEMCDSILPDEERMAEWLSANLPLVVRSYLVDGEMTEA